MHAQRMQKWEEEESGLQLAIEEKREQLQQIDRRIAQHDHSSSTGKDSAAQRATGGEVERVSQRVDAAAEQQPQPHTTEDETKPAVVEVQERLQQLRAEEEEVRRRMREERRQLNRDNMALLLAIDRNRQRLQQQAEQSDDHKQPTRHIATFPTTRPAAAASPSSASAVAAQSPPAASSSHDDEMRTLRQQLIDERRRVEALQMRRQQAEQDSRALHARLDRLKHDVKRHYQAAYKARLTQQQQRWQVQLDESKQHSARLERTVQSLQQRVEELNEEVAAVKAQSTTVRQLDRHRLRLSGGGGRSAESGKENEAPVIRKRVVAVEEDDGLEGIVDGLKGLSEAQAALHSQLQPMPAKPTLPPPTLLSPAIQPQPALPITTGKQLEPVRNRAARRLVVPLSPTLSTVSSIADEAEMSCCESHTDLRHGAHHSVAQSSRRRSSAARCMR